MNIYLNTRQFSKVSKIKENTLISYIGKGKLEKPDRVIKGLYYWELSTVNAFIKKAAANSKMYRQKERKKVIKKQRRVSSAELFNNFLFAQVRR